MARQVKSVSLLPRHMQIAERMPNFSSFVQEALDAYAAEIGQGVHTYAIENRVHGKCNPMYKHLCKICWPRGRPSREDWLIFRNDPNHPIDASEAGHYQQLIEQTFAYDKPEKKSAQATVDNRPKVDRIAWIRRFWR